jgi:hypothetical protein
MTVYFSNADTLEPRASLG